MDCSKPGYKTLKNTTPLKSKRKGKPKAVRDFYAKMAGRTEAGSFSDESGVRIHPVLAVNIAHILPKETFPEFATDTYNILLLTWEEHTRFDELLNRHEFEKLEKEMPRAWSKATTRLKSLLPNVENPNNLSRKLEEYLNGL